MNAAPIDELGPVDYVLVELPDGSTHFSGAMAAELAVLADTELIRVLDLLILEKDEDGVVEAYEIDERESLDELGVIEEDLAEILAEEDVTHLGAAMTPGSLAGVVIWENTWLAPFAAAVREAGGRLVADGRIPLDAIRESLAADAAEES